MKRLVYLVLGTPAAGRKEVLADLITDGLRPEDKALTLVYETDQDTAIEPHLGRVLRWGWDQHRAIRAELPDDAGVIFLVNDGLANPVDQVEAFRDWTRRENLELARIFCVIDCQLAEKRPGLLAWYDACIHFSDVVLLNRREGVANKWISDFIERYSSQCMPCLFELVKSGRVKNPVMLLEPQARRISQAFEEDQLLALDDVEIGEEDEDKGRKARDDEEEELRPVEDPYFQRRPGGRRVREIPHIQDFLE